MLGDRAEQVAADAQHGQVAVNIDRPREVVAQARVFKAGPTISESMSPTCSRSVAVRVTPAGIVPPMKALVMFPNSWIELLQVAVTLRLLSCPVSITLPDRS